jgi:hypothetical protein
MIKKGFIFPRTIERLRQGPWSKYLDAYSAAQFEHGYERDSIRQQILVIADFSGWIERQEIAVRSLEAADVDRFLFYTLDFFDFANSNSEYAEAIRQR